MNFANLLTGVLAALALSVPALGNTLAGTYSDLRYVEESGDLVGTEIMLVPVSTSKYMALVQCDEGELSPVVYVPAVVQATSVSISVPAPSACAGLYTGKITRKGFEGTHSMPGNASAKDKILLKHQPSYWDR